SRFDLGVTGGFGADGAMQLVRETDVAVVFGASLNQFTMRFGELFAPGTRVFQIDVAPAATHAHIGGFVRADARVAASALVERVRADAEQRSTRKKALPADKPEQNVRAERVSPREARTPWRESVDVTAARAYPEGDALAPDGRLDPRSAARRIAELLPEDRVVVSDGGHFIGWANMYWP